MTDNIETTNATPPPKPKKFLDRLRDEMRLRHYSLRTEQSYVAWTRRYILFSQKRHPQDMGAPEVRAFLRHLAVERKVTASTQNQAFNALVFDYEKFMGIPLGPLGEIARCTRCHLPCLSIIRSQIVSVLEPHQYFHLLFRR